MVCVGVGGHSLPSRSARILEILLTCGGAPALEMTHVVRCRSQRLSAAHERRWSCHFADLGENGRVSYFLGQTGESEIHPMAIIVNPVVCGLQSLGILGRQ